MTMRRRQAGLSLVELMISMTLGLIILSGVLVVFVNSSTARNEVERTSRQIENGRYASELLTEDIRLAGFYGELNVKPLLSPPPAAMPANPCSLLPDPDWKNWIPIHLQGFDDAGFTSANCTLADLKPGTDVLVVRRARACVAGSTGCDAAVTHKGYLQVALCADQQATDPYKLGLEGAVSFDRQKRNCTTTSLAEKRQYLVHVYFISNNNGQGQQIPTLKRLELTATGTGPRFEEMPLVEGIEEFQLHYGLDTNEDGAPDVYIADPNTYPADYTPAPVPACNVLPVTEACKVKNWMNVVTVQFHLLARNIETSPNYTDGKTYNLGKKADGTDFLVSPGGAYRRHIYTGVVRVTNPAARKEQP